LPKKEKGAKIQGRRLVGEKRKENSQNIEEASIESNFTAESRLVN